MFFRFLSIVRDGVRPSASTIVTFWQIIDNIDVFFGAQEIGARKDFSIITFVSRCVASVIGALVFEAELLLPMGLEMWYGLLKMCWAEKDSRRKKSGTKF
ncbi:hypothetical protein VTO58DRAFT_104603 [Aureobasidium pullulans]|nr:hypothetical protein JADG_000588 [Aureobasidium pullulans]